MQNCKIYEKSLYNNIKKKLHKWCQNIRELLKSIIIQQKMSQMVQKHNNIIIFEKNANNKINCEVRVRNGVMGVYCINNTF